LTSLGRKHEQIWNFVCKKTNKKNTYLVLFAKCSCLGNKDFPFNIMGCQYLLQDSRRT